MLWAACCVGFFGFLHSGGLTAPVKEEFDASQHLTFMNIAVDGTSDPKVVSIRIKQSKTDPFRQEVTIFPGRTNNPVCPVAGAEEGSLLRSEDGQPLTRSPLVEEVRQVLQEAGVQPGNYAGHSFRIGAATMAAAGGTPVGVIKTLRRWKSQAYQLYMKLPHQQLADISKSLASTNI